MYYCLGTIYAEVAVLSDDSKKEGLFEKQLFYLRKCIDILESNEFAELWQSPYVIGLGLRTYTNYANALNYMGRIIAAIEQFKKALSIKPNFAMATGNLGITYQQYGRLVPDSSHWEFIHQCAFLLLSEAVGSDDPHAYEEAKNRFKNCIDWYYPEYVEKILTKTPKFPEYQYDDKDEYKYRDWALHNNLFLNPLNDLPYHEFCFAADVLLLPDMIAKIDAKPIYHGMFNQLKQEYVFARYQYYCGLQKREEPHFADKDTYLLNFGDYPQYSIRIEQIKCSFRVLYSVLDKVAYFVNSYFGLGIKERDVNYTSIWAAEKRGKNGYKYANVLNHNENRAISSLYWIYKDFHDSFCDSPNPHAKRISEIRQAFEHKYAKVCWGELSSDLLGDEVDDLVLYVSENELIDETLRLMKLIREVIICLTLAVGVEEQKRHDKSDDKAIMMPFVFMNYEDDWKV